MNIADPATVCSRLAHERRRLPPAASYTEDTPKPEGQRCCRPDRTASRLQAGLQARGKPLAPCAPSRRPCRRCEGCRRDGRGCEGAAQTLLSSDLSDTVNKLVAAAVSGPATIYDKAMGRQLPRPTVAEAVSLTMRRK